MVSEAALVVRSEEGTAMEVLDSGASRHILSHDVYGTEIKNRTESCRAR